MTQQPGSHHSWAAIHTIPCPLTTTLDATSQHTRANSAQAKARQIIARLHITTMLHTTLLDDSPLHVRTRQIMTLHVIPRLDDTSLQTNP